MMSYIRDEKRTISSLRGNEWLRNDLERAERYGRETHSMPGRIEAGMCVETDMPGNEPQEGKRVAVDRGGEEGGKGCEEASWDVSETKSWKKEMVRIFTYLGAGASRWLERIFGRTNLLYIWSSELISA